MTVPRVSKYIQFPTNVREMVLDTSTTIHITGNINMFHILNISKIYEKNKVVYLADDNTKFPIFGETSIKIVIGIVLRTYEILLLCLNNTIILLPFHLLTNIDYVIVYGTCIAIEGTRYILVIIERHQVHI